MPKPANTTTRKLIDGQAVFVKQYGAQDEHRTVAEVKRRTAREARLLELMRTIPSKGRRLGVLQLVGFDAEQASITTAEIKGRALDEELRRAPRHAAFGVRRALFLAGRWLRHLHEIETSNEKGEFSDREFVDYAAPRVERLVQRRVIQPDFGDRAIASIGKLVREAGPNEKRVSWCHCDYAAFNVFWDGHTLTPIDFEMCKLEVPLTDVSYFVHRLEMLQIQRPWKRWPISAWRRAFLGGYGDARLDDAKMYKACMIRHLLCRLITLTNNNQGWLLRWHGWYVTKQLRRRLQQLVELAVSRPATAISI